MPIPTPNENEEQDAFVSRCIEWAMDNDEADDTEQAAAMCYSQWREAKSVSIKSIDDDHIVLAGYGVVWGGKDLEGEYFTKETDFWFDRVGENPMVLYNHGQDAELGKSVLGRVVKKAKDDVGLWIEAQIDRHNEYVEAIAQLAEKKALGFSSGSIGHLVERASDGKILSWPFIEVSPTPTPAEPRTLGVSTVKSLGAMEPRIKALLGEDGQPSSHKGRDLRAMQAQAKAQAIECEAQI